MERLLLTGASGFLGRNFLDSLDRNKYEVFAVGRNCPAAVDREHFFQQDLIHVSCSPETLSRWIEGIRPEILVLFAWDVSTQSYWESTDNCNWADGTIQIAQTFLENGGRQILFAGTSASYDYGKGWLKEKPEYEHPASLYGITKLYTSQVLGKLAGRSGAIYCEARIFSIYGNYEKRERLIPLTAWRLSKNERIVNTCGELLRDYIYVGDAVNAMQLLIDKKADGIYNISSGKPVSIGQIIRRIAEQMGKTSLIEFHPSGEKEPFPFIAGDAGKLRELGFTYGYSLEQGIRLTLEWMTKEGKI